MRGTIVMWSGERGVVSAGGQRYDFDIHHWHGTTAPAANMTVDLVVADGRLGGLTPVDEADLAREKLAAVTGEGSKHAWAIFENVGKDVAIAYGAFLVLALFVSLISSGGFAGISITLADLLSGNPLAMLGGNSGKGTLLVLLATATITVPYFWKHKFAPLAFTLPLLFTLYAFWPLYKQHREQQQAIEAMGEFGSMMGQMAEQMGGASGGIFNSIGFGAYLVFATAVYLAFKGVTRFLAQS